MPKDREKNRYFEVGLERGSWTLSKLEEDARKHQMGEQIGKFIAVCLTEYYEWKERAASFIQVEAPSISNGQTSPGTRSSPQHDTETNAPQRTADIVGVSQQEAENADEAADYWSTL